MGNGYTRTDTADNIADGNVINASDLDGEFNSLQSAFVNTSGHTHDGTAGEGAPIEKIGPNQEVVVTTSVIRPAADNTIDLGVANTNEFKNLYIDGTAYLDSVDIDGGSVTGLTELTVDNISLNGNTITTTNTNGNLNLRANGNGIISVDATDVNFGDSDKATFGDSADLSIFHDGSNSYIQDSGTGNLYVKAGVFRVYNAAGNEIMANFTQDAAASLYYNNGVKIATTDTGINVVGDVAASDNIHLTSDASKITFGADNEVELLHSADSGLTVSRTSTADDVVTTLTIRSNQATLTDGEAIGRLDFYSNTSAGGASNGTQARINIDATASYSSTLAGSRMEFATTASNGTLARSLYLDDEQNAHLDDNKKLILGTGSDLQIYHDGSHSIITDVGTGNLYVRSNGGGILLQATTNEDSIVAVANGAVILYHDNATKLATTATGIDVTGTVTADGLSVVGAGDTTVQIKSTGTGDADALLILDSAADGESEVQFFHDGTHGASIQWFTDGSPDLNITTVAGTDGVIDFQPNNSNAMRIQSDGNVRIGGDVISATITGLTQTNLVVGSATGGEIVAYRNDNAVADGDFVGAFLFGNDDNNATEDHFAGMWAKASGTGGSVDIKFAAQKALYEADTPQMLLRSEGDLVVGGTSSGAAGSLSIIPNNSNGSALAYWNRTNTTAVSTALRFDNAGVAVGAIIYNNNSTAYNTSSDYRLKTDAQPMTGASARVQALNPVNFEWIASGDRVDGFLAHEAQSVVPECATGTKDAMRDEEYEVTAAIEATYDDDGNELTAAVDAVMGTRSVPDYQGIDQSKIVPLLTAALREALTKIDDLETRLTALEAE